MNPGEWQAAGCKLQNLHCWFESRTRLQFLNMIRPERRIGSQTDGNRDGNRMNLGEFS
jgi:hypothetical protein